MPDVSAERIQPPLFKVEVSPQTPVGVYTIPESPTTTPGTVTVDKVTGVVDPEFQVSKKYPTIGYVTGPANLTIDVIPPLTLNETFKAYWATYGSDAALLASGAVGAFSAVFVDYLKDRQEYK